MKSRIFAALLALVMLFGSQSAKAWGWFGHSGIAYVAEQHLTPEAKEKCQYYLRHTLAYYASWMDYWRFMEIFKSVNNPHSNKLSKDGMSLPVDKGGNPKGRVLGHLRNALAELGDGKYKSLPDSVVRQRLINMVHYLPDMHCPSHVGGWAKTVFSHYAYVNVSNNGKPFPYHSFWDSAPMRGRKGWSIEEYGKRVDKVSRKQAKVWTSGTLTDWGRDIARGGHRGRELLPKDSDIAHLTPEQNEAIMALADEMAMMAAYRLAFVLNTIFSDGNIPVK